MYDYSVPPHSLDPKWFLILKILYFTSNLFSINYLLRWEKKTYGSAVNFFNACDDFSGDHNGISWQHFLKHENSEVEIVDESIAGVSPWIEWCQRSVRRVAATVTKDKFRRVFGIFQSLAIMNSMDHHVSNFGKIPSCKNLLQHWWWKK